jgi:CRP-like cAMP-binding protein
VLSAVGWSRWAALDRGQQQAARIRELLRGVWFLRSLPLPRLERLVRGADPRLVSAGEDVIRLGEAGDEFYVIERGRVDIVEFGTQQSAGEGFGEIALLRDVPRTATVRACTELQLWAISRPAFIGV